jgi:hypothetical protein
VTHAAVGCRATVVLARLRQRRDGGCQTNGHHDACDGFHSSLQTLIFEQTRDGR